MGWSQAVNHCTPTTGRGRTQKTQQESSDLRIPCNEHYRMFQMLWDSGERLVSHKVDFRGGTLSFNLLSAEPTARPGRRTPTGTAWPRPTRARPCAVWSSQVRSSTFLFATWGLPILFGIYWLNLTMSSQFLSSLSSFSETNIVWAVLIWLFPVLTFNNVLPGLTINFIHFLLTHFIQ